MVLKKGIRGCGLEYLFLCLLYFLGAFSVALAEVPCGSEHIDEVATVRYVHDGDTLHLRDGRKVRLIGINTPELARKNKAAEPYSAAAKNALTALFRNNKSIALRYGVDKKDRYGRLLAHGFLADGQNIQAILLNRGLASAINVPPNTQFAACYLQQEHVARCKKAGLWHQDILQAARLKSWHKGFHLVQGRVTKVSTNNKGIWLTIDHKLTVGIRPDDQPLFNRKVLNNMLGQTIVVRGWLNKRKKPTPFYIRVRHPLSIQSPLPAC